MDILIALFIIVLFVSIIINIILAKFNVPTIIGYIIVGVGIKYFFGVEEKNLEILSHISEMGIVFMMFMIGLEFSFRYLLQMKKEVFVYGFLEVFLVGVVFSIMGYFIFNLTLQTSLIVGFTLSLSSTAIVVKMLNSSGDINKQYGRKALGILIFQDIAVIPIMLMVEIFSRGEGDIISELTKVFISAVILIIALYILGRFIFEKILTWVSKLNNDELFISSILLIVFASSYISHIAGFSPSLGAFIAGVLIAETHFKYQIEADIAPFRDLLLGLFFITVGINIDPIFILNNISKVFLFLLIIMLIKFIIIYAIIRFNVQHRTSIKTALALMQVGEFALAVFQISTSKGLLDNSFAQILSAAVVLSMIITPFVLQHIKTLADKFSFDKSESLIEDSSGFKKHIIIVGYGPIGKIVAEQLKKRGLLYVIVEKDYNLVQEGIKNGESIYLANITNKDIFLKLNVLNSCGVVVAIDRFKSKRLICEILNSFEKAINIIAFAKDKKEKEILNFELNINNIIVLNEEISKVIVQKVLQCDI